MLMVTTDYGNIGKAKITLSMNGWGTTDDHVGWTVCSPHRVQWLEGEPGTDRRSALLVHRSETRLRCVLCGDGVLSSQADEMTAKSSPAMEEEEEEEEGGAEGERREPCYLTASPLGCGQHTRSVTWRVDATAPRPHASRISIALLVGFDQIYLFVSDAGGRGQCRRGDRRSEGPSDRFTFPRTVRCGAVRCGAVRRGAATDSMSQHITVENCYEILSTAKKQGLGELKERAYRFMSDNFLEILREPLVYGRLSAHERDLVLRTRLEGKKCLMVAETSDVYDRPGSRPPSRDSSRPQSPLCVVCPEETRTIHYYSETSKEWRPLTRMPDDVNTRGCGMCTMYNYLFVAGGIKGDKGKVSDKVFCYNPVTDAWSEMRPLIEPRSQLKLVSLDGYLYAVGGECLFTVEKYDPRVDRWTPVAPLPRGAFAVAHEATACNGEIYVSGGSLFYRLLKYDPRRDEWQECPYNNSRKRSTDMVAFKNFIYRFDVNRQRGISVFRYNTVVKVWQEAGSLEQEHPLPFRCAIVGNRVYCVNRSQVLQCLLDEENISFGQEPLKAPREAKGALLPFVLSRPEKPESSA